MSTSPQHLHDPIPLHKVGLTDIGMRRAAKIAAQILARSGIQESIEKSLIKKTGRPQEYSWRVFLLIFIVHAITRPSDMHLTHICATGTELSKRGLLPGAPHGRHPSYDQVSYALRSLASALADGALHSPHNHQWLHRKTGELHDCPPSCPSQSIDPALFAALLLGASVPDTVVRTGTIALDSTDYETHAARKSWGRAPDVEDGGLPTKFDSAPKIYTPGWPKLGADGRDQHTLDPDARAGYRSGHNLSRGDIFVGWDLHVPVMAPRLGDNPVPGVALGLEVVAAGSYKAAAGIRVVDSLQAAGTQTTELLADRGYSYAVPENWSLRLLDRNITNVMDLHPQQRGVAPGPRPGTIWVDGGLFTAALPERLRNLPAFTIGMDPEEKRKLHERYDERRHYAFTPLSQPDPRTKRQRMRGPAQKGQRGAVRCPNSPGSMRAPYDRPETNCAPGQACGCAITLMLDPFENAHSRQILLWGTTEWSASYGRRVAVESFNSELKIHRAAIKRGYTRVFGTAKNHILLTFAHIGVNVRLLRSWYARRGAPDPWMVAIGDTIDPDWSANPIFKKERAKRHEALHVRLSLPEKDPA